MIQAFRLILFNDFEVGILVRVCYPKRSKFLNGLVLSTSYDKVSEHHIYRIQCTFVGEMDRLRKFWLSGACHSKKKIGQSSHQLGILNFTSAFILLASGIILGCMLLIFEHMYFRFGRKVLKKYDKCGCCALVSLVRIKASYSSPVC